jgi:hypothetical protein
MKQSTLDGINRYVNDRCPVGSFLTAVLSNNLRESFARADEDNLKDMFEIVSYCYNKIPSHCWGSPEKVQQWLEMKDE